MSLRKTLIKTIYETIKDVPSVEDDVNANLDHINKISNENKEKYNKCEEWILKEIPKILKESFDPKYISNGIRIPLEVKIFFTSRTERKIFIDKDNGIPIISVHFEDNILTKFKTEVNNQINETKKCKVEEKVTNIYEQEMNFNNRKKEMEIKAEALIVKELKQSGFSFKKRENSYQRWVLIDLESTKENSLNPEYVELYKKLKSIYY